MKHLLIILAGVVSLTSCGTAGNGAFSGAMFGGMIGSAIGGITGGPRGSDVGTLIGMATGAATGAAVGAASEKAQRKTYSKAVTQQQTANDNYDDSSYDDDYYDKSGNGNDIIYMDPADSINNAAANNDVPSATIETTEDGITFTHAIDIRNCSLADSNNECHIAQGETVKLSFEIHNVSNEMAVNLVPAVRETTRNKRLAVSPATLIENLGARKAVRYTAYISAKDNLKTGTAHFRICVVSNKKAISNTIEFDVPLN